MHIEFYFRNFEPSDHLKEHARTRFEKISKHLGNIENADLQVNMSLEKFRHKTEVVLVSDNLHLSAYEESDDMYSSIDMVLDKLESQVRRIRERVKDKKRGVRRASVRTDIFSYSQTATGEVARTIIQSDDYQPKPMSIDEAAMQLESLKHDFLVFQNAETERVNVIYRHKKGDFGLIDPGV